LFDCAHRVFAPARKGGEPLSFLMLDIDDFKTVNDTYGHQEGDNVLQRIAECGRAALRRGDLFGRIGGEEFAAVFPGCTPQMALQVAERLQRQIQQLSFKHKGQTFGITVSQGLTSLTAADENVENLFSRADAAMYQAKREGKNRIVTA
jgi:diguanylate cyclase (GGDEF)-like protein